MLYKVADRIETSIPINKACIFSSILNENFFYDVSFNLFMFNYLSLVERITCPWEFQ
ncbi:hypothetical protein MtrunA17_Chr4g0030071 [Medicago truncatula]|uniref:Uncharacterized protein n=1 Tax=Medicago truncatula TaxID=3880 RepID=A0A396I7N2_MEDTR|nr:hypothetical protein MtrunA17_Chr4g0030071 [Medicago truncatula]